MLKNSLKLQPRRSHNELSRSCAMITRNVVISVTMLVLAAATSFTPSAGGGSLAPDPLLATISAVRLTVGGDLGFDPIPDFDQAALRAQIRTQCWDSLHRAELRVKDSADAFLLVTIRHSWHGDRRDMVALLITTKLGFPADPAGAVADAVESRRRSLTIWSDQRLELVRTVDASATIIEALNFALADLVEERLSIVAENSDP